MLKKLFRRKIGDMLGLFQGHYMDARAVYAVQWDVLPCMAVIGELDTTKVFSYINEELKEDIERVYQHSGYDHGEESMVFNTSIFILKGQRLIELGPGYCQVLHTPQQYGWATEFVQELASFREQKSGQVIGFSRHAATS